MRDFATVSRGIRRRLVCDTRWIVERAGPLAVVPPAPDGCSLVRISSVDDAASVATAENAMQSAGSSARPFERIERGDEFFAWHDRTRVLSFGWVSYASRILGTRAAAAPPGRAFVYHFHTLPGFRGRGLYPALLLQVRHVLGLEGKTEIIADVQAANAASRRGLEKAGFTPAAFTTVRTFLMRYERERDTALIAPGVTYANPIW